MEVLDTYTRKPKLSRVYIFSVNALPFIYVERTISRWNSSARQRLIFYFVMEIYFKDKMKYKQIGKQNYVQRYAITECEKTHFDFSGKILIFQEKV